MNILDRVLAHFFPTNVSFQSQLHAEVHALITNGSGKRRDIVRASGEDGDVIADVLQILRKKGKIRFSQMDQRWVTIEKKKRSLFPLGHKR